MPCYEDNMNAFIICKRTNKLPNFFISVIDLGLHNKHGWWVYLLLSARMSENVCAQILPLKGITVQYTRQIPIIEADTQYSGACLRYWTRSPVWWRNFIPSICAESSLLSANLSSSDRGLSSGISHAKLVSFQSISYNDHCIVDDRTILQLFFRLPFIPGSIRITSLWCILRRNFVLADATLCSPV